MSRQDLSELITARLGALGLSKSELARRAGISRQGLYKVLAGEVEESKMSTFLKLAHALETHPTLLMQALFSRGGDWSGVRRGARWGVGGAACGQVRYAGDGVRFVRDVTLPGNALVMPGSRLVKTWRILNAGRLVWEGREARCMDQLVRFELTGAEGVVDGAAAMGVPKPLGLRPEAWAAPIPTTAPGETADVTVVFHAPEVGGTFASYWQMTDAEGALCFPDLQGLACVVCVGGV